MDYKVKPNDTLSKIASRYSMTVEFLMSFNKAIKNPNQIFIGQIIKIPNIQDVPQQSLVVETLQPNAIITKARSAINKGIRYKLSKGGMKPELPLPTSDNLCDCSGFVCWALGLSRKSEIPFYKAKGGWIYTDSMVADVNSPSGIFEKINTPEVGCIVVYGAGAQIGHVGFVSEVTNGKMTKVIHCSSGNDKKFSDSIQETSPAVFNRADALWGRFVQVI